MKLKFTTEHDLHMTGGNVKIIGVTYIRNSKDSTIVGFIYHMHGKYLLAKLNDRLLDETFNTYEEAKQEAIAYWF